MDSSTANPALSYKDSWGEGDRSILREKPADCQQLSKREQEQGKPLGDTQLHDSLKRVLAITPICYTCYKWEKIL